MYRTAAGHAPTTAQSPAAADGSGSPARMVRLAGIQLHAANPDRPSATAAATSMAAIARANLGNRTIGRLLRPDAAPGSAAIQRTPAATRLPVVPAGPPRSPLVTPLTDQERAKALEVLDQLKRTNSYEIVTWTLEAPRGTPPEQLLDRIRVWQAWHGITPNAWIGPDTLRSIVIYLTSMYRRSTALLPGPDGRPTTTRGYEPGYLAAGIFAGYYPVLDGPAGKIRMDSTDEVQRVAGGGPDRVAATQCRTNGQADMIVSDELFPHQPDTDGFEIGDYNLWAFVMLHELTHVRNCARLRGSQDEPASEFWSMHAEVFPPSGLPAQPPQRLLETIEGAMQYFDQVPAERRDRAIRIAHAELGLTGIYLTLRTQPTMSAVERMRVVQRVGSLEPDALAGAVRRQPVKQVMDVLFDVLKSDGTAPCPAITW